MNRSMKQSSLCVLLLISLVCLLLPCSGADTITTIFVALNSAGFPDLTFRARVVPPGGETVANASFEVLEKEQRVASFSVKSYQPVCRYVLVLDRSTRTGAGLPELVRAATETIASLPATAQISVVSFGGNVAVDHPFSGDRKNLVSSLTGLAASGPALLAEAMNKACDELIGSRHGEEVRTVILLTSGAFDGAPQAFDQVAGKATGAGVRFLIVGFGSGVDEAKLKPFAQKTRGGFMMVPTAQGLPEICGKIVRRLLIEQYVAGRFTSPNPTRDGSTRMIKLAVKLKEQTGQGTSSYVAPKDASNAAKVAPASGSGDVTAGASAGTSDGMPASGAGSGTETGGETAAGGVDGTATVDGPAPAVSVPTPRVNVHELKDKLNQQTGDDGLGEGE